MEQIGEPGFCWMISDIQLIAFGKSLSEFFSGPIWDPIFAEWMNLDLLLLLIKNEQETHLSQAFLVFGHTLQNLINELQSHPNQPKVSITQVCKSTIRALKEIEENIVEIDESWRQRLCRKMMGGKAPKEIPKINAGNKFSVKHRLAFETLDQEHLEAYDEKIGSGSSTGIGFAHIIMLLDAMTHFVQESPLIQPLPLVFSVFVSEQQLQKGFDALTAYKEKRQTEFQITSLTMTVRDEDRKQSWNDHVFPIVRGDQVAHGFVWYFRDQQVISSSGMLSAREAVKHFEHQIPFIYTQNEYHVHNVNLAVVKKL